MIQKLDGSSIQTTLD